MTLTPNDVHITSSNPPTTSIIAQWTQQIDTELSTRYLNDIFGVTLALPTEREMAALNEAGATILSLVNTLMTAYYAVGWNVAYNNRDSTSFCIYLKETHIGGQGHDIVMNH